MPPRTLLSLVLVLLPVVGGCINAHSQRGVEPRWMEMPESAFVSGETTRSDVLELLGPPSQILSLEDETLFYYLHEDIREEGLILIVYNDRKEQVSYDRAVFFFDEANVLREHAFGGPDR